MKPQEEKFNYEYLDELAQYHGYVGRLEQKLEILEKRLGRIEKGVAKIARQIKYAYK